jgi:CHAD domain-containing protein
MPSLISDIKSAARWECAWDLVLPDLRPSVGQTIRLPEETLRSTYFDTRDLRLWERGITLRYQEAEDASAGEWILTSFGDGIDRDRELTWPASRGPIPPQAQELIRGIVRRAPLGAATELVSTRRRLVFRDSDGTDWGELDDELITVVQGPTERLRFREIELEANADADRSAAVVNDLSRAGACVETPPRLARALGLAMPDRPLSEHLNRRSTIGDVVMASLDSGLRRLLDHDFRLRATSSPDPEDVHQARVASRRLRSDLKTFRGVLDPVWVDHTRVQLEWLGDMLGRVRNFDVFEEMLTSQKDDDSDAAEGWAIVLGRLARERSDAASIARAALDATEYLDLVDRLHAARNQPPFFGEIPADAPAKRVLPGLVGAQWRRLRRRVRKADATPSDDQLHRIRIAAKQLRYGSEAAQPVIGKPARRVAKDAEQLQELLGNQHDSVTLSEWVRKSARAEPRSAFAAGWIAADQASRQRKLRGKWESMWRRLTSKKRRKWMG